METTTYGLGLMSWGLGLELGVDRFCSLGLGFRIWGLGF